MKNLMFTPHLACGVLLLVFSVHGIANAQGTLTLSPTSITGQSGDAYRLTVTVRDENGDPVSDVVVRFAVSEPSGSFLGASDVTNNAGIVQNLLILPMRSAIVSVSATDYPTAFMRVKVLSEPHKLVIVSGDNQEGVPGGRLPLRLVVRVSDINDYVLPEALVTFFIISGEGDLAITIDRTDSEGEAWTLLTLGDMPGENVVEVSVGDVEPVRFRATAVATAEKLLISSGAHQTGLPNKALAARLVVQAVDGNGSGVQGVKVTFEVTAGGGSVSPSWMVTDTDGFAAADLIPNAPGTVIVEASAEALSPVPFTVRVGEPPAKVVGVSGSDQNGAPGTRLPKPFVVEVQDLNAAPVVGVVVTFRVAAGGGGVSARMATTGANGQAQTYFTLGGLYGVSTVTASVSGVLREATFKATSQEQVLVAAEARPPLYWIHTSAHTLHRLVGGKVENLVPRLENITSLAVDAMNGFLYFGVKTGKNRGEIRRSALTGGNVQTLKGGMFGAPIDITLDSTGGMLYWTGADGKIKRTAAAGNTRITSVLKGLDNPTSLAVSNGYLYWTEALGRIRRVRLTAAEKVPMDIATGLRAPRGIAIAKGKIYWIEHFGGGGGRLRRANLNGTHIEELRIFPRNVPVGIAVDGSENKIYWTRFTGKIQRANLAGRFVKDIVTGLRSPTVIVLGGSVPAHAAGAPSMSRQPLLASARPAETVLLANYPNPFNPETWIPYHLATGTDVRIHIYNAQGVLVRVLRLGHQSAGYYTGRGRAVYWDGRNGLGERVASGVYFYRLVADGVSRMRKMVILK